MATQAQAQTLLQRALAQPQARFREGQWDAIDALVNHRRKLLVVQRTGWGKSSVYFIATRLLRDAGAGPTILVSPLLALMRNQIEAAQRLTRFDEHWKNFREQMRDRGKPYCVIVAAVANRWLRTMYHPLKTTHT